MRFPWGRGAKVENRPTLGQELLDLKMVIDEGTISNQEYNEMKEKLKKSDTNQLILEPLVFYLFNTAGPSGGGTSGEG
jgi:hypothetical protein